MSKLKLRIVTNGISYKLQYRYFFFWIDIGTYDTKDRAVEAWHFIEEKMLEKNKPWVEVKNE